MLAPKSIGVQKDKGGCGGKLEGFGFPNMAVADVGGGPTVSFAERGGRGGVGASDPPETGTRAGGGGGGIRRLIKRPGNPQAETRPFENAARRRGQGA